MTPYKPTYQQSAGYGPRGQAKIQINSSRTKVRVTLREVTDDEKFIEHNAELDIDDCPPSVQSGMWFVSLSSDKSKMYDIHPWNGMATVHTKAFTAKKDQPPTPRTRKGQYGDFTVFSVLLEITDPDMKGMTCAYELPYNFFEAKEVIDGKEQSVVGISHPKSKFTDKLVEYLDITGAWNRGPMKFSDNILPVLEKRILHEDSHFKVIFQKGYINTIYADDSLPKSENAEE